MSENGCNYLIEEIEKALDYCRKEFHMNYSEIIGVLEMVKHDVLGEAQEVASEDEEKGKDDYGSGFNDV